MKAKIKGIEVEGTPEEIMELIRGVDEWKEPKYNWATEEKTKQILDKMGVRKRRTKKEIKADLRKVAKIYSKGGKGLSTCFKEVFGNTGGTYLKYKSNVLKMAKTKFRKARGH